MSSIVEVETLNGTEFVNLDTVRRFVVSLNDSLELRFGSAETLILTGDSAQLVLEWVKNRALDCTRRALEPTTAPVTELAPEPTPKAKPKTKAKPQRQIQLMPLHTARWQHAPERTDTTPTLDRLAASVQPVQLSHTIDRQQWLKRSQK